MHVILYLFLTSPWVCTRTEVADCSTRSYERLSVKGATQLLMFNSEAETLEWAKQVKSYFLVVYGQGHI